MVLDGDFDRLKLFRVASMTHRQSPLIKQGPHTDAGPIVLVAVIICCFDDARKDEKEQHERPDRPRTNPHEREITRPAVFRTIMIGSRYGVKRMSSLVVVKQPHSISSGEQ